MDDPRALFSAEGDADDYSLEDDYDAVVMYDMVSAIPPEQQEAFVALLQRGIGLGMEENVTHPDTGQRLKGFVLPDWEAVREACLAAATIAPGLAASSSCTRSCPLSVSARCPSSVLALSTLAASARRSG